MNQPRRKQRRRGGQGGQGGQPHQKVRPLEVWDPVAPLPSIAPFTPTSDAAATIRSLGDPPLHAAAAGHYLAAVVNRAAVLASALAASAGLVADPPE